MRTRPFIGDRAWFGPRRTGWGWTPVSWHGWLATVLGVASIVIAQVIGGATAGLIAAVAVAVVLVTLAVLFGTSPGSKADGEPQDHRVLRSQLSTDDPELGRIIERLEHRDP
jgi:hypothetical protein